MFLLTQYFQLVLGLSPLAAALRLLPMGPIMLIVSPSTPRLSARFGANKTVSFGMALTAISLFLFRGIGVETPYVYVLVCLVLMVSGMALAMSPMTAAIMSAVPPRRAGAGSAMNDATRELGAALGVAVLGSVAASRYTTSLDHVLRVLPPTARDTASSSLAGALHVASTLPPVSGRVLQTGAVDAFMGGIHLAVTVGAVLAAVASVIVLRYLPRVLAPEGALHGPLESAEDVAELGLGGVPPIFSDLQPSAEGTAQ
jgi:Na+/melibiose symporter-like transporter